MDRVVLVAFLLVLPAAAAAPETSWNGDWFIEADAPSTLTVNNETMELDAAGVHVLRLPNGLHAWNLTLNRTGTFEYVTGHVLVHDIVADLAKVNKNQTMLAEELEAVKGNQAGFEDRLGIIQSNLTALQVLPSKVNSLQGSVDDVTLDIHAAKQASNKASQDANQTRTAVDGFEANGNPLLLSIMIVLLLAILSVHLVPAIRAVLPRREAPENEVEGLNGAN